MGPAMLFSAAPTDSSSHSSCELGQVWGLNTLTGVTRFSQPGFGKETERRHLTLTRQVTPIIL